MPNSTAGIKRTIVCVPRTGAIGVWSSSCRWMWRRRAAPTLVKWLSFIVDVECWQRQGCASQSPSHRIPASAQRLQAVFHRCCTRVHIFFGFKMVAIFTTKHDTTSRLPASRPHLSWNAANLILPGEPFFKTNLAYNKPKQNINSTYKLELAF